MPRQVAATVSPLVSARRRSQVKSVLTRVPLPGQDRADRAIVLCYHSVHPTRGYRSATPEQFDLHLQWLGENCEVVPFRSVVERARRRSGSRPVVAITFDDGYDDNHEHALPALVRRGLTATFFVTVGLVERDPAVTERFERLRYPSSTVSPMSWSQVKELRAAGMDVGSHTWSHPNLARLTDPAAAEELARSRAVTEDRLGEAVTQLAYPFGKFGRHFTTTTMRLAAEAGYDTAAAVLFRRVRTSDSALNVPRFFVRRDSPEDLRAKVTGRYDMIGLWQEHAPRWAARLLSPEDFAA